MRVVLAVHGGAGIILRSNLTPEKEDQYRNALKEAMAAGYAKLANTDACQPKESVAIAAVEAAVRCMEDNTLFNAGKGSVVGNDGKIRMDASIMHCYTENEDGSEHPCNDVEEDDVDVAIAPGNKSKGPHQIIRKRRYTKIPLPKAGAVAAVVSVKNPISLARAVMDHTPHVMLVGQGAKEFACSLPKEAGVEVIEDEEYFRTERRWNQLMKVQELEAQHQQTLSSSEILRVQLNTPGTETKQLPKHMMKVQLDHADEADGANQDSDDHDSRKFGTVGCVAMYLPESNSTAKPQIAAATSTGGMTNQRYNRVGDSPIIGAGTYANHLCAISCTGHGEHFIRSVAAHDIAKRLEYKHGYGHSTFNEEEKPSGHALQKAVEEVILGTVMGDAEDEGGDGGAIAIDKDGNLAAEMNCPGMYHGWVYENGEMETRIFWDEEKSFYKG